MITKKRLIYYHDLQLRNRNSVDNQTKQANTANQSNATAILYLIKVNCKNMILNTYATQFCKDYKCLTPLKQNKTTDE